MKICVKCKVEKENYEFSKNKTKIDGLQKYCKQCKKIVDKKWYNENPSKWKLSNKIKNQKIKELLTSFRIELGGKCKKCEESREHLLDFHHKIPELKENLIPDILIYFGYGEKAIKKARQELKKCILLCSNCHRDFHYLEKKNKISIKDYLNGKWENG